MIHFLTEDAPIMSSLDDMYLMLRHAYEEFPEPEKTGCS